ncbi:Rieske 2Fe-2S domain-containing protein [Amycolatopsis rubida]|uniref:Toluene monooxygenase system ferredoxin subunit n=1 Tax=Amycolatopsis rubida TaxID=112413 RepID=A0A1I5NDV6_9PSEU|nr:Rieske 2Fe-2S domain-containing protein [Amycolatopsis rubida]SFP19576.1 toluene monooxygenase system ferredoxin subunit [Amycolatopsis rubida]
MTNAGSAQATGTWRKAIELDELWEGEMTGVEVAGTKVLLVNLDGDVRAYENRCPHQEWALDEGDFDGEKITCSRHLWEFDAASGAGVNPTDCRLKAFPCRVTSDDTVEVDVP